MARVAAAAFALVGTVCLYVSALAPPGPSALCFALAAAFAYLGAFIIYLLA